MNRRGLFVHHDPQRSFMTESASALQDEADDTAAGALPHNGHAHLPLADNSPSELTSPRQTSAGPAVWGEALLRRLENGVLLLDRLVHQFIPPALNPFAQIGAIAKAHVAAVRDLLDCSNVNYQCDCATRPPDERAICSAGKCALNH